MSQSKALPDGRASAMPFLTVGLLPCSTPYAVTGFLFWRQINREVILCPDRSLILFDKAPPVLCSVRSRTRSLSPKLSTIRTHDATSKSDSGVNGDTGFCCVRFAFIV